MSGWWTVKQSARYVNCSPVTLLREARNGRLQGYKVGGRRAWRFKREDLDAWLEQRSDPEPFVARPHRGVE